MVRLGTGLCGTDCAGSWSACTTACEAASALNILERGGVEAVQGVLVLRLDDLALDLQARGQLAGLDRHAVDHAPDVDAGPIELDVLPGTPVTLIGTATDPDGNPLMGTIAAVEGDEITVDFNHPLAGQTLNFAIEVVSVREATEEEQQHGHVQGGHQH